MKILLMDIIAGSLKEKMNSSLYGIETYSKLIISSLTPKNGLKKIAYYSENQEGIPEKESLILFQKNTDFICINFNKENIPTQIPVKIIPYKTDFQKRNSGIIDEEELSQKTVTIIGIGSGGSGIAQDLVRCGIQKLILIDFDTVTLSNICRSTYTLEDIGNQKTASLTDNLLRINPCLNITTYNESILDMEMDELDKIVSASDFIVEATDSIRSKTFINGIAHNKKPVIYSSVYDKGIGGDILFTLPGLPCFECVFNSIIDDIKEIKRGEWDYSTDSEKPMPALLSDIQIVVARTVKIIVGILLAESEKSCIEKITEPGCTLLLIGNEKDAFIFSKPFQETWAETQINPDCMCQTLR